MTKKLIPAVKSLATMKEAAVFVMIVVAILLSISLVGVTIAKAGSEHMESTIQGEVVAVDNLHSMKMLTLRSDEIGAFPNDSLNIFLDSNTKVMVCNAPVSAEDINVSRNASVTYHEVRDWLVVADKITQGC